MQLFNTVAIYKGKGEKNDLTNDRGIFFVNIFTAILMKIIYEDNFDKVDENMYDLTLVNAKKIIFEIISSY